MLKKITVAVAAALVASLAHASSPYDGAYACTGFAPQISFGYTYDMVFLTKVDGVTAASSVLAPVPTAVQLFGYSFGTLNGNVYTGTGGLTGQTGSVTFNANGTLSNPNAHIMINGVTYAATENCVKIF